MLPGVAMRSGVTLTAARARAYLIARPVTGHREMDVAVNEAWQHGPASVVDHRRRRELAPQLAPQAAADDRPLADPQLAIPLRRDVPMPIDKEPGDEDVLRLDRGLVGRRHSRRPEAGSPWESASAPSDKTGRSGARPRSRALRRL